MAFLKKSLFLVLFLGLVSLSICEEEKRETEEEENDQEEDDKSEEKRFLSLLPSLVSGAVSLVKILG
uniref:Phylloseptin-H7 n=1 Tax=Pithecopus hypochondrialis TaxID=317381 RepID=PLS7_PITHY|nr:RecName: Full=Phylloseptin-H7; Short=PLS-H7; AltName: Full=Phylloseptin-11; Short=PS-11; AltName: Full=Phylloseptin-9; Short=PS-9; Flags: Precursor [Pithecopus hypochondrialis]CAJ76136.1 phylloseptin-9 protein precursor [Pithecopus hypochondrialis]